MADLSKLHTDIWRTLTADQKADVLRLQLLVQEVFLRSVMAATGIQLARSSADAEEEQP